MASDLISMSIAEAGDGLKQGQFSVGTLTQAHLNEIAARNDELHAFVAVLEDQALARAEQLDAELAAGQYRGPMHGIPVAVKDLIDISGTASTMGSRLFADEIADDNAPVISALYDAGAVVLGKLNMDEFALGVTGVNSLFPRCVNPLDPARISGGSSSGSGCATAAKLCMGSLGTDTGGSIRVPSSLCGVAGLKPTFGRVSKRKVRELSFSQDHVGPIARSVQDVWTLLLAVSFGDSKDPSSALSAP